MTTSDTTPKRPMRAATYAARLRRFDRLVAEFTARVEQLQAGDLSAPTALRAMTRATRALKRHASERADFIARFAPAVVGEGAEVAPAHPTAPERPAIEGPKQPAAAYLDTLIAEARARVETLEAGVSSPHRKAALSRARRTLERLTNERAGGRTDDMQ